MIAASLILIGAVWGGLTWWVFRRVLNHRAMRTIRKRIHARLLEIRLYSEEPALVWKAQGALIVDNLRLLLVLAPAVLILAVPFALLYTPLDSIYGYGPIQFGHTALVTVRLTGEFGADNQYNLIAPSGITVETPPVRDFTDRQVLWRVRASAPAAGILRITKPGGNASGTIAAGERTLMRYRVRESAPWIEVEYPRADITIAGWSFSWLVWFFAASAVTAVILMCARSPGRPRTHPIPKS